VVSGTPAPTACGKEAIASSRRLENRRTWNDYLVIGLEALLLDLDDSATIRDAVNQVLSRTQGQLYALFNNGAYIHN